MHVAGDTAVKRLHWVVLLLAGTSIIACAGPKIGYDYDSSAQFGTYRTYDWDPEEREAASDKRADNTYAGIRIRTAVGAQLLLRGYKLATDGKPDFYVAYHLGLKELSPDSSSQYLSRGMAGQAFTYTADTRSKGTTYATLDSHLAGSLLVDIIDAGTRKLVWRGTAAGEVDQGLTTAERNERIRALIHEMLSHFPPK